MNRKRYSALILAGLLLGSCSPPMFEITAAMRNGSLSFDADFPGIWPLKWDIDEADVSYLEVVTEQGILWAVESKSTDGCTKPTQNPDLRTPTALEFPIAYGTTPNCFVQRAAPKSIPTGAVVTVRAAGAITEGYGYFRLLRHVAEVEPDGSMPDPFGGPTLNKHWGMANAAPADEMITPADDRPPTR